MSKLSTINIYIIMNELIKILAHDVQSWNLVLKKYKSLKIFVATNINNKQQLIFLSEQAINLLINDLLNQYFILKSHKVFLFLTCFDDKSELVDDTSNDDDEKDKSKIKMKSKYEFKKMKSKFKFKKTESKFKSKSLFIKILFS